mmetsp:Transcript_27992/g.41213  ORF Transcript_27992/g.41213 Transcript_27992/m.41213 type:complete len:137 (+) Transcript_27992:171-581(+)
MTPKQRIRRATSAGKLVLEKLHARIQATDVTGEKCSAAKMIQSRSLTITRAAVKRITVQRRNQAVAKTHANVKRVTVQLRSDRQAFSFQTFPRTAQIYHAFEKTTQAITDRSGTCHVCNSFWRCNAFFVEEPDLFV